MRLKLCRARRFWAIAVWSLIFCFLFGISFPALAANDPSGKTVISVEIAGNVKVPESEITKVIKVAPGDVLNMDAAKQDMQSIYDLGYFYDVTVNFREVPEGVNVIYTVKENPVITGIVIKGNTKVPQDKLLKQTALKPGEVLNNKTLYDAERAIEAYYHGLGYILAKVSDVSISPDNVLTLTVSEGILEGVVVKGNQKTKTYVITRELTTKIGEPFNAKDARRSMQKIYNLGYFEDVNVKLNPGREPNAVVMELSVVEQKTGTFTLGGGYSSSDGLIGIIELADNNFRGTGDKAKIHWEFGGAGGYGNYELTYTKPWLDDKQTSLTGSIYRLTYQYNDYGYQGDPNALRTTYNRTRMGYYFTWGRPSGEYVQNYITFKHERSIYADYVTGPVDYNNPTDPAYANYLKDNFGLTNSLILNRVFDNRDNIFNPTEGHRSSIAAEFAGGFLGGDFTYSKYTLENRYYFKVGSSQVVALRGIFGYGLGSMPEVNQFAIGGADSLRGYQDYQFKGDKVAAATVEYRFPIVKKVQACFFTDMGKAWNGNTLDLGDIKYSYGVGLRVDTPLGPIRLDYGITPEGNRTHFSFGGQF